VRRDPENLPNPLRSAVRARHFPCLAPICSAGSARRTASSSLIRGPALPFMTYRGMRSFGTSAATAIASVTVYYPAIISRRTAGSNQRILTFSDSGVRDHVVRVARLKGADREQGRAFLRIDRLAGRAMESNGRPTRPATTGLLAGWRRGAMAPTPVMITSSDRCPAFRLPALTEAVPVGCSGRDVRLRSRHRGAGGTLS